MFNKNTYELVSFEASLEYLYDPVITLQKAMSWLKHRGLIHVEVPNAYHFVSRLINLYCRMIGARYVTNISRMHKSYHIYEFTLG